MCGIAGYFGNVPRSAEEIATTLKVMARRGPDYSTSVTLQLGNNSLSLLHSRLSIIDLDPRSHQPFRRGPLTLIFNGEIYNYREIRHRLEQRGHTFETESDTEVLAAAWEEYGVESLGLFEGMWSFALFDARTGCLYLSRDRFGEKPLYLYKQGHGIFFGSETTFLDRLASVHLEINVKHLQKFLVYGYRYLSQDGSCFLLGIENFPAAHVAILKAPDQESRRCFWKPVFNPKEDMSEQEMCEGTRHHLLQSLRVRLRADVRAAFCLSGGVDSGALASLAAKEFGAPIACYSLVDPDPRYNEEELIHETVKDLDAVFTPIYIEKESDFQRLRHLTRYHNAPILTLSYYIHSLLSEKIAQDGCKVAFSGSGADELFSGYYDHFLHQLVDIEGSEERKTLIDDWNAFVKPVVRNPYLQDPLIFVKDKTDRRNLLLGWEDRSEFLTDTIKFKPQEKTYCSGHLRNRMLNELFEEVIPVILNQDDLNSMCFSIENRSPYLDSRLCEFTLTIPTRLLINRGYAKHPLRSATQGYLNDAVRLSRVKKGFNASILSVFDVELAELRDLILSSTTLFDLVKREKVEMLLSQKAYVNSESKFLFSLISSKIFLEERAK